MELGVIDVGDDGRVVDYHEKPETSHQVSMGIYVYEPAVLGHIERGRYLDFPTLVLRLLERGERVCAYRTDCLWLDIGRPDDYARAQELYAEKRESIDIV
jgi:NDP-sugar pyrophosphorylase family protein